MCYSTSLRKDRKEVEKKLLSLMPAKFKIPEEFQKYYHLNGFTHGNLYIIKMDKKDEVYPASWGLVPEWANKNPDAFLKKSNTLNARSETIFETPSFKKSVNNKRCLILADGFYEPHHENGIAIPYFCYQPTKAYTEGDLFMFAGLYSELENKTFTATIITTKANEFFAEVHNKRKRMPLVLAEHLYQDWLDDALSVQSLKELMFKGFSKNEFKAHPVSRDFFKKDKNTNKPYIVEPVENYKLF